MATVFGLNDLSYQKALLPVVGLIAHILAFLLFSLNLPVSPELCW